MYIKSNFITGCHGVLFCLSITLLVRVGGAATINPYATTATPEICRVSEKYANCSDVGYRIGCPGACNVDCSNGAGPGMESIGNKGTCLIMTPDKHKSKFYDAITYCKGYGATLAKVEDVADGKVIAYYRTLQTTQTEIRWHIAGTLAYYSGTASNFSWLDTSTFDNNFWVSGQPSLVSDTNYCMTSHANDAYMLEGRPNCDDNVGFMCVKEPVVTAAAIT